MRRPHRPLRARVSAARSPVACSPRVRSGLWFSLTFLWPLRRSTRSPGLLGTRVPPSLTVFPLSSFRFDPFARLPPGSGQRRPRRVCRRVPCRRARSAGDGSSDRDLVSAVVRVSLSPSIYPEATVISPSLSSEADRRFPRLSRAVPVRATRAVCRDAVSGPAESPPSFFFFFFSCSLFLEGARLSLCGGADVRPLTLLNTFHYGIICLQTPELRSLRDGTICGGGFFLSSPVVSPSISRSFFLGRPEPLRGRAATR